MDFDFIERNKTLIKIGSAVLAIGAISSVNIYGFLSDVPSAFWSFLDAQFVFNYFFLLTLFLAFSTFTAHWLSEMVISFSNLLDKVELDGWKLEALLILRTLMLTFLSQSIRKRILFLLISVVVFLSIYASLELLLNIFFTVFFLVFTLLAASYFIIDRETRKNLGFEGTTHRVFDEILEMDWELPKFYQVLPLIVFFSLLLSNSLGELRAKKILKQEPVSYTKAGIEGRILLATGTGFLLVVSPDRDVSKNSPIKDNEYIFISFDGDLILKSKSDFSAADFIEAKVAP